MNHCTEEEANVEEISGIAYQFNPQFFDDLYAHKGIKLENIVYYKDETHYFVMTAGKASLLKRGALKEVKTFKMSFNVDKRSVFRFSNRPNCRKKTVYPSNRGLLKSKYP